MKTGTLLRRRCADVEEAIMGLVLATHEAVVSVYWFCPDEAVGRDNLAAPLARCWIYPWSMKDIREYCEIFP